jgi:5-deoxy-D-glucuronate isomerase
VIEFPLGGNVTFGPSVDAGKASAVTASSAISQKVNPMQTGRSDVAFLAATLQKERIDQERKLLRERLLKDLSGAQHVDPLSDYHRLMEAADTALARADPQKCVLNTSHVHLPATANSSSAHCTSPLAALEQAAIVAHSASHLPHIFSDSWIDERFIENESFCGLCGDGGDLICCEVSPFNYTSASNVAGW